MAPQLQAVLLWTKRFRRKLFVHSLPWSDAGHCPAFGEFGICSGRITPAGCSRLALFKMFDATFGRTK
ncbi:hypothetical protein AMC87_PD00725 (plasmid) [Rhizobium phaseoli]|uniref:Uncharacterized protein n=1 Tax=Rhizobium etli (strain CIAT 652) TaxID=491916 RepID=B3Q3J4_RHIE6|nr:hypothetical protein RHECIAT_PC0000674 [Rhizobium etli CIAT 652]ANL50848.1 hypothetical protein AMC87_PD00725 [Rhizobium phaseoli]